jgi:hypothetical protein
MYYGKIFFIFIIIQFEECCLKWLTNYGRGKETALLFFQLWLMRWEKINVLF